MGVAASAVVFAVLGAGLAGKVAVVTDGQLSGLTNVGITVAEVAPEAAAGGPIGLVENGDIIAIDVAKRTADLEVSEPELRAAARTSPDGPRPTSAAGSPSTAIWSTARQRPRSPALRLLLFRAHRRSLRLNGACEAE